jgi:hypothetical protein
VVHRASAASDGVDDAGEEDSAANRQASEASAVALDGEDELSQACKSTPLELSSNGSTGSLEGRKANHRITMPRG